MIKRIKHKLPAQNSISLVLILIAVCVVITFIKPQFLTYNNIFNVLRTTSLIGSVAIGMTFVIITGGIDLSVGSVVGFSSVIVALLLNNANWHPFPAIIVTILLCMCIGLFNGLLIHKGRVPAFIATLGNMQMFYGLSMLLADGRTLPGLPSSFTSFAQLKILGMSSLFVVWLIIIILAAYILKQTVFGRNIYAIGSNAEAARLCGVKVGKTIYATYMVAALCSGIAGLLLTSRITSGQPSAGQGYELEAIAAAVIGGASLSGARGSILGTVLGALIMAILSNGGTLLGISSFIMDIIIGALVIIAVLIDKRRKKVSVV